MYVLYNTYGIRMYLKIELHVLFICLVIFLKNEVLAAQNDKICLTSNIIGFELIKHCGNDTSVSTYVGHGSICTIKCKNTSHFVNVSCENGIWTDKCTIIRNKVLFYL
ncbi:hypothetical protein KUTeg_009535 [Tegillarca granosa]|uniref:Secreted protein n=1 Tax=Tegillarca granosa TaxID=220873 RepID=A0ABQ9F8F5_TEGGR|nr:hypothetical protein KUTeg_009535 [Tegillarca granosa]